MNRQEYLEKKERELENLINNSNDAERLKSENAQLFALRMGATINKPSYKEYDLWAKAIYLSSKASLLLQENINNKTALKAMKSAAEIFLNLYYLSKEYDKEYSLVLSAICFDIAGYQANASALIYFFGGNLYQINNNDETSVFSNYLLSIIQLFLTKSLFSIQIEINTIIEQLHETADNLGVNAEFAFGNFFVGIKGLVDFLLYGTNNDYEKRFTIARNLFQKTKDVLLYHLVDLFITRCKILNYRCIWNKIEHKNLIWDKYLKLISTDLYSDTAVNPISKRTSRFELWISQLRALEEGLLDSNKSFVVQMPTGAGKTFIAELAILKALTEFPDKKCIYITPFRTLTNEVKDTLSKNLNKLNFVVSNVIGSYEIDESQTILIEKSDVIIATPEKIDLLFRTDPEFFENISIVIIDEGHIVGNDDTRAFLLELLISKLKYKLESNETRFIFISAVVPDNSLKNLSLWISSSKNNIIQCNKYLDEKQWQSTNRIIGKVTWSFTKKRRDKTVSSYGNATIEYPEIKIDDNNNIAWASKVIQAKEYKKTKKDGTLYSKGKIFPADDKGDISVELAYKYSDEGPVLIFTSLPKNVLSLADKFIEMLELKSRDVSKSILEYYKSNTNKDSYITALEWFGEEHTVTKAIKLGIGIHYGDMPEAVRKAVEKDFRDRKLRVLIATSTIAQGVNFPIKTIIVHSLIIFYSEEEKKLKTISKRDFLNIVGRAGRPGKEAEGLILYPVLTKTDEKLYKDYCLSNTADDIYSIIFKILISRLSGDLTEEIFTNNLEYIFSASILDILAEETVETTDEELIDALIGKTLFYIQAQQESIDISSIKQKVKKIRNNFYIQVPDENLRKLFSQTGFSFSSCLTIKKIIEEQAEILKQYITSNDYLNLILFICLKLVDIPEMFLEKEEISGVVKDEDFFSYFLKNWIECHTIEELRCLWFNRYSELSTESFNLFLENVFNYKYPWGISVFINLMIYILKIENTTTLISLKTLPSLIKYGVNTEKLVWLRSLGIQSRATANKLNNYFLSKNLNENFKNILMWFANITFEELNNFNFLNNSEKNDILKISQNIILDKNTSRELKNSKQEFWVVGIRHSEKRKKLSNEISVGDILEMKRDYKNEHDQFAITFSLKGNILGYVPRLQSKNLAIQMDLYNENYKAEVINKFQLDDYSLIFCSISNI